MAVREPDAPRQALALNLQTDGTDKGAVRITVAVPAADAIWWPDFADAHAMHPRWRRIMEEDRDPDSWWVVARPIPMTEVVNVELAL